MIWRSLIEGPWIVFVAYWAAGARRTRRTVSRESFASRYGILFLEILGFVLLFSDAAEIGVLGRHNFPRTYALAVAGVALTRIGIARALWARWHLGQYWSARVTLKEEHKLIRTGPYAHFRHPIYSGIDLAAICGALAIDPWRCVAGVFFSSRRRHTRCLSDWSSDVCSSDLPASRAALRESVFNPAQGLKVF